ncbi:hypothetical protein [Empedobacter falsenii]|uniref:hypothetical protein n=1 Tax=Empedobacter falsenii TaxID=343874 RepID=UPI002575E131|nr:hypothetical protein [Empedobacter falsenii]
MIDYVLHYEKIANELCESREKPELLCNGFCYLKEEISKSEKNQSENHFVKNSVKILDAIVPQKQIISPKKYFTQENKLSTDYYQDTNSDYIIRLVFHPPIV